MARINQRDAPHRTKKTPYSRPRMSEESGQMCAPNALEFVRSNIDPFYSRPVVGDSRMDRRAYKKESSRMRSIIT